MANRMNFCVKSLVFSYIIFCAQRHSTAFKDLEYSISSSSKFEDISVMALGSRSRRQVSDADVMTQNAGPTTSRSVTEDDTMDNGGPTFFPEEYNVKHDDHRYYTSHTFKAQNIDKYWVELDKAQNHNALSNSYRTAATANLPFNFTFYGHPIDQITIATGGFLYMSPFIHKFLTATQYIAPLMANFDTKTGGDQSTILYKNFDTPPRKFIVEWRNVHLQDQEDGGSFQFQTHLYENGSIYFVYKKVPVAVLNISAKSHPVKIGLSDAFYFDTTAYGVKRRTIYEYHRVTVNQTFVEEGTVVVMFPLPTCNLAKDCETCLSQQIGFNCKWCGIAQRCSDGVDWYRQDWLNQKCLQYAGSANCSEIPTTPPAPSKQQGLDPGNNSNMPNLKLETVDPGNNSNMPNLKLETVDPGNSSNMPNLKLETADPDNNSHRQHFSPKTADPDNNSHMQHFNPETGSESGTIAVIVVVVVIIVALVGALGGWLYYAYTHPTSASGMWLIEHRPSQMKSKLNNMKFWKKSASTGDRYAVESTA